jgi:hypothetical protein
MIFHMVLFRPRPDLSAADSQAFADALRTAIERIPTIRRVSVGRRITHGAEYEQASLESLDYAAVMEFDDLAGLRAYLGDPDHRELGDRLWNSAAVALVYDYDMHDGFDVQLLLKSERE